MNKLFKSKQQFLLEHYVSREMSESCLNTTTIYELSIDTHSPADASWTAHLISPETEQHAIS